MAMQSYEWPLPTMQHFLRLLNFSSVVSLPYHLQHIFTLFSPCLCFPTRRVLTHIQLSRKWSTVDIKRNKNMFVMDLKTKVIMEIFHWGIRLEWKENIEWIHLVYLYINSFIYLQISIACYELSIVPRVGDGLVEETDRVPVFMELTF